MHRSSWRPATRTFGHGRPRYVILTQRSTTKCFSSRAVMSRSEKNLNGWTNYSNCHVHYRAGHRATHVFLLTTLFDLMSCYPNLFILLPHCMKCRRGLARRILSVCPSVCLSVTRVIPDKMEERSVKIFIPYERTFIPVFWEDRMVGGGRPLLPEILGQPTPIGTKSPIFNQ